MHFTPVGSISSKHGGAFTNQEGSEKLIYTNAVWGNLIFPNVGKSTNCQPLITLITSQPKEVSC